MVCFPLCFSLVLNGGVCLFPLFLKDSQCLYLRICVSRGGLLICFPRGALLIFMLFQGGALHMSLKNHCKVKGKAYPPVKIIDSEEEPYPHPAIQNPIRTRGTPPPAMQNHWIARGGDHRRPWKTKGNKHTPPFKTSERQNGRHTTPLGILEQQRGTDQRIP